MTRPAVGQDSAADLAAPPGIPAPRAWLSLALLLVACAAPIVIALGGRDSTHTMETILVVSSQETWLRLHQGETAARFVAYNEGQPRIRKPPLAVWLNLLAWSDLDPATAEPQTLVVRARVVTVILGLATLAAVFWIGCALGDLRLAVIATLAVGSSVFLQRQARTASYDAHVLAWTTIAVAGAFWALRPRGPDPATSRRLIGWGVCAASLTLAVYSKNPLPLLLASIPIAGAIALTSSHRRRDLLWLLVANLVAVACVLPWYAYVLRIHPETAEAISEEVIQTRGRDAQPVYYYLGIFALMAPWTLWLICGLVHPFVALIRRVRAVRLVPWVWFVGVFVLLSIPAAKQQRYILPLVAPSALLIAAVWRDHAVLWRHGRLPRDVMRLVAIHWGALAFASVGLAGLLAFPDAPGRWIDAWEPPVTALAAPWSAALLLVLLGLVVVGGRSHRRGRAYGAALASGAWGLIALATFWHGYAGAPAGVNPLRHDAEVLRAQVGEAPLRLLRDFEERSPEEEIRLYFGHLMSEIRSDDLAEYAEQSGTIYVLAYADEHSATQLEKAGFVKGRAVRTRARVFMDLWSRP